MYMMVFLSLIEYYIFALIQFIDNDDDSILVIENTTWRHWEIAYVLTQNPVLERAPLTGIKGKVKHFE